MNTWYSNIFRWWLKTGSIRLQPDYANAFYSRAFVLKNNSNYRAAITDYQKYLDCGAVYATVIINGGTDNSRPAPKALNHEKDTGSHRLSQNR
jgi:hypothetical protein